MLDLLVIKSLCIKSDLLIFFCTLLQCWCTESDDRQHLFKGLVPAERQGWVSTLLLLSFVRPDLVHMYFQVRSDVLAP
jgi:hypothetical protein